MAAYAAVVSLTHTINDLLKSSRVTSSREILEFAYNEASSLQRVLERLNDRTSRSRSSWERVDASEGQIRDCANKLEDVLEFHELKLEEEEEEEGDETVMREEISSFNETAKRMEIEYIQEISRDNDEEEEEEDAITGSSDIDFGVLEMIGHSRLFDTILGDVLYIMRPDDRYLYAFWGEQGTGARLVAKNVFEDVREKFECWGRVRVGTNYELRQVLKSIISQVVIDVLLLDDDIPDEELSKYMYGALENRRYMIMLDDLEDVELLDYLERTSFPNQSNGSVVFITTNSKEVAVSKTADVHFIYDEPDMYENHLWFCIRQALFGEASIPAELELSGEKIVHSCGCRSISAAKTLLFLSKTDHTMQQWSKIAADKENPIFMIADEISEISDMKKDMHQCKREVVEQVSFWIDFSHRVEYVKSWMYPQRFFSKMQIISFFGMAGIGKTTFARKIFKDDSTFNHFDHHVWISIGLNYQSTEILIDILAQIFPEIKLDMEADQSLIKELCAQVFPKKFLIVLDDLCNKDPLFHLKNLFPDIKGTILVTTRLPKVAKFERDDSAIEMQLLDKEESWCLLRQKVFDGELCPPELEKAGRKISEKCDGLPLLILTVAVQLCKVERSEEYWNNIALGKEKSVFKSAHHQISKALLPSYQNLPQHLKPCFLYLGVFLEKYEIPKSNLTNMWISEGFMKPNLSEKEDLGEEYLLELVDLSLVMVQREVYGLPITKCRLHAVFWHLSNTQVVINKLFHAVNNYDDCSPKRMEGERRLCIRNNSLLGMKDVHKSMASNTRAHSLLCIGSFHQYPVLLNFGLRLLRLIDAYRIRLYEFPTEVTSLFHLKYLSLTCNGNLPTSIFKLWKLQHLTVKRYMNIKSSKSCCHLPSEIWDMKELKHLQIMGGCLPDNKDGSGLLKLSTLLDVSAQSCGEGVLKWTPNVKRFGIRIELAPTNEGNSFSYLNNIHHLHKLESLKCVVVNPQIRFEVAPPLAPMMFPRNLTKLSLSGFGYPWECISIIGKLENLQVLKLKRYAFQGPKWEMDCTNQFMKLRFLLLEDSNLVKWKLNGLTSLKVERVCIKHCYKLQELPQHLFSKSYIKKIEIVDSSPLLVTWIEKMQNVVPDCEFNVHRSWLADTKEE